MGLAVTFVSGIRRSGKSALISTMIQKLWKAPPHYIRLARVGGDKLLPQKRVKQPPKNCGVASARWIQYDSERIFEVLPEVLTVIYKEDRFGSVVIEADADPILRHAYTYDHRVFVMPKPTCIADVFRDPREAANELRKALDDTAAFADEIFGLFAEDPYDEDPSEDRPELTGSRLRGFLYSPFGDELATRIQLQKPYHGLVESDVIVVNTRRGQVGPETQSCLQRLEFMLNRIRGFGERQGEMIMCNPAEPIGDTGHRLIKLLRPMCRGGK